MITNWINIYIFQKVIKTVTKRPGHSCVSRYPVGCFLSFSIQEFLDKVFEKGYYHKNFQFLPLMDPKSVKVDVWSKSVSLSELSFSGAINLCLAQQVEKRDTFSFVKLIIFYFLREIKIEIMVIVLMLRASFYDQDCQILLHWVMSNWFISHT